MVLLRLSLFLTLYLVPHLSGGIVTGVGLSILLFFIRSMPAGCRTFPDSRMERCGIYRHRLPTSDKIAVVRFDGSLYFGNPAILRIRY